MTSVFSEHFEMGSVLVASIDWALTEHACVMLGEARLDAALGSSV